MKARLLAAVISLTLPAAALAQDAENAPPPAPYTPPPPAAHYTPPPPAGDTAARFGDQGQVAIGVDLPLGNTAVQFGIVHQTQSMGGPSVTQYRIAPSADFFVIPNLSLGLLLEFEKQTQDIGGSSLDVTAYGVAARLGYNIPLSDLVSIWPRVGIGYTHGSSDVGGGSVSVNIVPFFVDVPLLFHPAPHFFIGPGFMFATQLSNSASAGGASLDQPKTTQVGADLTIGGYFGGV